MTKDELLEVLFQKHFTAEIKVRTDDNVDLYIDDVQWGKECFSIFIIVEHPNKIQHAPSNELIDELVDRDSIKTCCDHNIGWEVDTYGTDCPICKTVDQLFARKEIFNDLYEKRKK